MTLSHLLNSIFVQFFKATSTSGSLSREYFYTYIMTDRNSIIGLILLIILFYVWVQFSQPTQEQLDAQKKEQEAAQRTKDSLATVANTAPVSKDTTQNSSNNSSAASSLPQQAAKAITLENDVMKVTFNTLGGKIQAVELKKYTKLTGEAGNETQVPVQLLEDRKNKWEFNLPLTNSTLNTGSVVFEPTVQGNKISFKYTLSPDKYFEQTYTVTPNTYQIDYQNNLVGLGQDVKADSKTIELVWENYLDKHLTRTPQKL